MALDLLHFADPSTRALHGALDAGTLRWISDAECAAEFERVLRYPELRISEQQAQVLLAAYEARVVRVADGPDPRPLPSCRDPDDQKFIRLAARENARWLLTRDKALLRLSRRLHAAVPGLRVCTAATFASIPAGDY